MQRIYRGLISGVCLLLWLMPAAAQDTPPVVDGDVLRGTAYITDVNVDVRESDTRPVIAVIEGELADPCTDISDITQRLENRTFFLTVETARPLDAMCVQMTDPFTIEVALDVAGLEANEYAILVGNEIDVFDVPAAATVPVVSVPTEADCLAPGETTKLFLNPEANYCFLYPAQYEADLLDPTSAFISSSDPALTPAVSLLIQTEAAGERTLDTIADQIQQEAGEVPVAFNAMTLGGEAALVTDDIAARVPSRYAFVLHNNMLYTLTLQPVDSSFADATATAEALWQQVTESFLFIRMEAITAEAVPTLQDCPSANNEFAVYGGEGYCFRYRNDFTLIEPDGTAIVISEDEALRREMLATLTVNVAPNRGMSLARLADNLQASYPETDLNPTETTLGGEPAITFTLPGRGVPRQETYVLWDNNLYTFTLQPVDRAQFPQASVAAQNLWQTVRDSLVFFVSETD